MIVNNRSVSGCKWIEEVLCLKNLSVTYLSALVLMIAGLIVLCLLRGYSKAEKKTEMVVPLIILKDYL